MLQVLNINVVTSGGDPKVHSVIGFQAKLDNGARFEAFVDIENVTWHWSRIRNIDGELRKQFMAWGDPAYKEGSPVILTDIEDLEYEFFQFLKKHMSSWSCLDDIRYRADLDLIFIPYFENSEFLTHWGKHIEVKSKPEEINHEVAYIIRSQITNIGVKSFQKLTVLRNGKKEIWTKTDEL